jgi:hypothetical protein
VKFSKEGRFYWPSSLNYMAPESFIYSIFANPIGTKNGGLTDELAIFVIDTKLLLNDEQLIAKN